MLPASQLQFAIEIQERCYKLLSWLQQAIARGFIPLANAHAVTSVGSVAADWVQLNLLSLPVSCRPETSNITAFGNFFGTYLEASFDLVESPTQRLTSKCGCYCTWCSQLTNAQHLKPKSLSSADKKRATKLCLRRLEMLANEEHISVSRSHLENLVTNISSSRQCALATYGWDLLERLKGFSNGPATLALWRAFAWSPQGSPIKRFKLSAKAITEAEQSLVSLMLTPPA